MEPRPSHLSIWDLGHHWVGKTAAQDDVASLPEVQRAMTLLLQAVTVGGVMVCEAIVLTQTQPASGRKSVEMLPIDDVENLHELLTSGRYERKTLANYWISLHDLFMWCIHADIDFPDFVVPDTRDPIFGGSEKKETTTRPEVIDKKLCQDIALEKWKADPLIRIAEMARDHDIRRVGNGALYGEPTLWRWLREIAPSEVKGRRGRPSKRSPPEN